MDLQLKFLEEQQRLQQEFLERKYQLLSQIGEKGEFEQYPSNMTCN